MIPEKDISLCISESDFSEIGSAIDSSKQIFLANENSMVDITNIDEEFNGCVGPVSSNLEYMTGNPSVIEIISKMKNKKDTAFFPGTLIRDFGGYFLPIMPVIIRGNIVCEKVKQTGIFYIDDDVEMARILFGDNLAEEIKKGSPLAYVEPRLGLYQAVQKIVDKKRQESIKSFNVNGYTVLPIICNEIGTIIAKYEGSKVDIILHSCSNFFKENDAIGQKYAKNLNRMREKGLLNEPTMIGLSQIGRDSVNGIYKSILKTFFYEKGKLKEAV